MKGLESFALQCCRGSSYAYLGLVGTDVIFCVTSFFILGQYKACRDLGVIDLLGEWEVIFVVNQLIRPRRSLIYSIMGQWLSKLRRQPPHLFQLADIFLPLLFWGLFLCTSSSLVPLMTLEEAIHKHACLYLHLLKRSCITKFCSMMFLMLEVIATTSLVRWATTILPFRWWVQ